MNKESTQQSTPSNESIEQMAERIYPLRDLKDLAGYSISDFEDAVMFNNEQILRREGYRAALVEMHQTAQGMKWVKERLNKEIEKIKDEFNSRNDQRSYSIGSYLQTQITTLNDVLKWLDEPRTT